MLLPDSEREDLRTYFTECITALRWLKDRQLTLAVSALALQLALYTEDIRNGLVNVMGCYGVVWSSVAISSIYVLVTYSTIRSSLQTRRREDLILESLAPRLRYIVSSTRKNDDWRLGVDILFYFAHLAPVMLMTLLHWFNYHSVCSEIETFSWFEFCFY